MESRHPNSLAAEQSERTGRYRLLLAVLLLAPLVAHVLYLKFSPPLGLAADEAHYWDWSRQLDWSYYSKGPAVAVLIRGGRLLFGDTLLGVRFPALVLAVGTSWCTWWLTRKVLASEKLAVGAVALTFTIPLFVVGSMLMTIDSPYYFCWAAASCFGYLAAVENRRWAWPMVGLCLGLGFLAKYAALLWLVGMLLFLVLRNRRALATPGPWVAILIAFAFTIPVLVWNSHHDWVSFGHVARSTAEDQSHFNPLKVLGNFGEMVGTQIGLVNPIVFVFMVAGCWFPLAPTSDGEARDNRGAYLLCIGLTFFCFVSLVTLRKNTEPNWPAPTYFTLIPLAVAFVARTWSQSRGWVYGAAAVGACVVLFAHEPQSLMRIRPIAVSVGRMMTRVGLGWDQIGLAADAQLKTLPPGAFVLCDKYQTTAYMAFYIPGHPKTYCLGAYITDPEDRDRLTQYDLWPDRDLAQPALRGRDALFVGHAPREDLRNAFDRVEQLPDLPIVRHGVTIRSQQMWKCYGFHGMTRPNDGLTKR